MEKKTKGFLKSEDAESLSSFGKIDLWHFWSPCNPLKFFDVYQYTRECCSKENCIGFSFTDTEDGVRKHEDDQVKSMACSFALAGVLC